MRVASRAGQRLVQVWIPVADAAGLSAEADSRGKSLSAVIREAVAEHLARGAEGRVLPLLERMLTAHDERIILRARQAVAGVPEGEARRKW